MGIREQLNEKPAITTGATIGIILVALIFIIWQIHGGSGPSFKVPTQRYYSDDDGATYYADAIDLIPPYDHSGKPGVIANVFKCKDGKDFVGYLQRYTAKGVTAMQKAQAQLKAAAGNNSNSPPQMPADPGQMDMIQQTESEYSLPGKGSIGWMKAGSKGADQILNVKCADGSIDTLEPVMP